jgi:hypothetical protein
VTCNRTNRRIGQTTAGGPIQPDQALSCTANALNQYSAVGEVTPNYDGNGNLTYDGTFTYGYDAASRFVSASGSCVSASYAYDAQGRRKTKTIGRHDDGLCH